MIWRDRRSSGGAIDAEGEQELRLIAQARAGAAWAVAALVARYQPPIVRYLVRLTGQPEPARELAESIFVRMGKRVRGPHGGEHLRLWLLRAATDAGLDALRHPDRTQRPRLAPPAGPARLLAGQADETRGGRNTKWRDAHPPRSAPRTQQFVWQTLDDAPAAPANAHGPNSAEAANLVQLSPREALRRRLVRAVLAELPYTDAQCLALHLVAGLNQSEVADALGLAAPVARRRIVQGLQLFGHRYEAALASLGLPEEVTAPTSVRDDALAGLFEPRQDASEPLVTAEAAATASEPERSVALIHDRDVSQPAPESVDGTAQAILAGEAPTLADRLVDAPDGAGERGPALAGAAPDTTLDAPVFLDAAPEDAAGWDAVWSIEPAPPTQEPGGRTPIVVDADPAPGPAASSAAGIAPDGDATVAAAIADDVPPAPGATDAPEAEAPRHAWDASSVYASLAALSASALADADYTQLYQSDLDDSNEAAAAQTAEVYESASAGEGDVDVSAAELAGALPELAWDLDRDVEGLALAGILDEVAPSMPRLFKAGRRDGAAGRGSEEPAYDDSLVGADGLEDEDHFLLVMEAEQHAGGPHDPRPPAAPAWEARRARVLSADGEAEDPADAQPVWPAQ